MELITLYTCKIGSHAYGLATPESDLDLRGVVVPNDLSYFFGLNFFEQEIYKDQEDHVAWNLQKFAKLAAAANTQMLEMLFSSEEHIITLHPLFNKYFLKNRDKFLTNKIYDVINGYAGSEYRKALGESSRDLGAVRKEDINNFGYSCRNASHCVRLLYAATHALSTGVFPVMLPKDIRNTCMQLKRGVSTLSEFKIAYEFWTVMLFEAKLRSVLKDEFDYNWLNQMLVNIHKDLLCKN
jgi:predicted nucleotidyltransferase